MFEVAERLLMRKIENILKIPMIIGVPDPNWVKAKGYPCGAVMLNNVKILDWIEDGSPDSFQAEGDKVIENYVLAEAEMTFAFHLFSEKKVQLDQLTLKLLYELSRIAILGDGYSLGSISFRDELPEPEGPRIFERIFAIPLIGDILETVITQKGTIEFIGEVSTSGGYAPK
uniref:Uncharacterized protein n=1 Tax=candidate division WOR-3 bacterium TaxID=2052148 RepID=A0A7C6A7R7_UNCW3